MPNDHNGTPGLTVVARRDHGAYARRMTWRAAYDLETEPVRAVLGLHHGLLLSAMAWLAIGLAVATVSH